MERPMDKRWRIPITLVVLAVVAAALYGGTLLRFGTMLGGAK